MYIKCIKDGKLFCIREDDVLLTGEEEITEQEFMELSKQIDERAETLHNYIAQVRNGKITLEEVPTEYYQEVYDIINAPEPKIEEEATEADYLNALEELGVDTSEEG